MPGYANPGPRMGMAWGRGGGWAGGWGRGRGWRHRYYATGQPFWARHGYAMPAEAVRPMGYGPYDAPPTRQDEVAYLQEQAEWLRDELETVTSRIEELEQGDA